MAKKSKDTTASTAKNDAHISADPTPTRNLVRLLNTLALLLAILAFLLQFFAVLTHHWKWQITALRPIVRPYDQQAQSTVYDDSRLAQTYGLFARDVKLYAHHDEQVDAWASTRFPRIDNGEESFHHCLAQTSTLRGALLTCSKAVESANDCYCRRYPHWNAVIFFEILALILLALLVIVCSLLRTHFHALLKPIGALLGVLAFISLLIGLIILCSYLKRETRSIADIYPHTYHRFADKVGLVPDQRYPHVVHRAIRRQTQESYRVYPLLPGQHSFNETHYQEYSNEENRWIQRPYSSKASATYAPRPQARYPAVSSTRRTTTEAVLYNSYGPVVGNDRIYQNTRAGIGWSTVLSILSMIPALLAPLLLAYSWLTSKKLGPEVQTVTTTTVRTEYVSVPQEAVVETVPLTRAVPTDHHHHDIHHHTVGDAALTTHHTRPGPYDNITGRDDHSSIAQTYRT